MASVSHRRDIYVQKVRLDKSDCLQITGAMNKLHCMNRLRARTLEFQPSSPPVTQRQREKKKNPSTFKLEDHLLWRVLFFIILYRPVLTGFIFQPLCGRFLSSEPFLLLPLEKRLVSVNQPTGEDLSSCCCSRHLFISAALPATVTFPTLGGATLCPYHSIKRSCSALNPVTSRLQPPPLTPASLTSQYQLHLWSPRSASHLLLLHLPSLFSHFHCFFITPVEVFPFIFFLPH